MDVVRTTGLSDSFINWTDPFSSSTISLIHWFNNYQPRFIRKYTDSMIQSLTAHKLLFSTALLALIMERIAVNSFYNLFSFKILLEPRSVVKLNSLNQWFSHQQPRGLSQKQMCLSFFSTHILGVCFSKARRQVPSIPIEFNVTNTTIIG